MVRVHAMQHLSMVTDYTKLVLLGVVHNSYNILSKAYTELFFFVTPPSLPKEYFENVDF